MEKTVLSICIASYNKAEYTTALVKTILGNKNKKLEVIVADNASDDDTVEQLNQIQDSRLKVVVNDHNIGGAANMVHAIYCGGGYSLYCNDRDLIYPEKLDAFIDFLELHPDYSCGWVCRNEPEKQNNYTEYNTVDALKSMCWRCEHPTGFFFNSDYLQGYDESYWKEFVYPDGWTAFPFENIQAELITKGDFVRYNVPVWHSTGDETHNKYISGFETLKTNGDRWFYTQNCVNRGKTYLDQFWALSENKCLSIDEKNRYEIYSNIIISEYKIGVLRFKQIFESDSLSYHYKVNPKKVTLFELRKNGKQIYKCLIEHIRAHEGKINGHENVIEDAVNKADWLCFKITLKSTPLGKIADLKAVRLLRGKRI